MRPNLTGAPVNLFATIAALTDVLTAGIIYGTDVFCALAQRPALARLDDATMAAVMGRGHECGERRLPLPGVIGILAAVTATAARAVSGSPAGAIAAGTALICDAHLTGPVPARGRPDQPGAHRRGRRPGDAGQTSLSLPPDGTASQRRSRSRTPRIAVAIVSSSTRVSRSCSDGSLARATRSRTPAGVSGPSPSGWSRSS